LNDSKTTLSDPLTSTTIATTLDSTAQNDTHTDYHSAKDAANAAMKRGVWEDRFDPRFVPLESREMRCDLPRTAIDSLADGKHYSSYRGIPMAKDPLDRVLYETLFFEVQPRPVIELGAYTGASAMWMADILQTFSIDSRVIAVDVDLSLIDKTADAHGGVAFVEGDLNNISKVLSEEMLSSLPRPLVLIDDAHVNIAGVYKYFDRYALGSGDYLVIEDTIPWIPGSFRPEGDTDIEEWGEWKWDEVRDFFEQCDSQYLVDRYYTDFFGYNATWNWNGFLRKS
jgi:cephalosporin hydroxylase